MLPPPDCTEYTYGDTPPEAVKVKLFPTAKTLVVGEIASAAFTVIVESDVLPRESVTRTTEVPALPAVKTPVVALTLPPPEKTEYEYGVTPPEAESVTVLPVAVVAVEGAIAKAALIVTTASAVFPAESVTRTVAAPLVAGAV